MLIFPGRGGGIGERVALRFPWKDSSKFELGPKEFFKTKLLLPSTKMGLEMGPVNLRVIKCCQVDLYMNQTSYPPKSQHILWNITPKHNPPKNPPKKIQITFKSHPTHLPPPKKNTGFFPAQRIFVATKKSSNLPCVSGIVTILSLFLSCGPWAPRSFLFVSYFGSLGQVLGRDGQTCLVGGVG